MTSSTCGRAEKELVAFGRKPADHDQSALQGIHALNPLILVDDACRVPKAILMRSMPWPQTRLVACWRLASTTCAIEDSDRADGMAIAFAGRANAAPMNVDRHAGGSITGDFMTMAR
jgi:hypothetical protein